jgi:hypothetical protein
MNKDHPSFGCNHIWFLFSVGHKLAPTGFIITEAGNKHAIYTIETILEQHDGSVSQNCHVVAVFRDAGTSGIRDANLVKYVKYVDFLMDYVDPSYIMADASVIEYMGRSISAEDRAYVRSKMDEPAEEEPTGWDILDEKRTMDIPSSEPVEETRDYQILVGALESLGFKKPMVKKITKKLSDRIGKEPVESLIKKAVQGV